MGGATTDTKVRMCAKREKEIEKTGNEIESESG